MHIQARERRLRAAVKYGWSRLVSATRPRYRLYRHGHGPFGAFDHLAQPAAASPALDPVALTVLAVNSLGAATLRTVAAGKPVTVTVPDARIGAIFRAALAEMQKTRTTDRLIDIVVAGDAAKAPPSAAR